MCGNAAALGRRGPGGPLLPPRGGFLAQRNIPGWRGKDLFLRVKKNPRLMPEGAPQVGNTLGLWGAEGRSEQDTRRFVAQGQEIKAIKAKMSLTHTHTKKKEIFFCIFLFPCKVQTGARRQRLCLPSRVHREQHNSPGTVAQRQAFNQAPNLFKHHVFCSAFQRFTHPWQRS